MHYNTVIDLVEKDTRIKRIPWYYAPTYLVIWVGLFSAVVYPLFHYLPTGIKVNEEETKPGQFVAERAQRILSKLDQMGPKIVGDDMNENIMVNFLLDEIAIIHDLMLSELYDLEVDVQKASGAYLHWEMINMYQAVQNVVVKLSSKNSNSTSYLLINSHYDTKPGSVGKFSVKFALYPSPS